MNATSDYWSAVILVLRSFPCLSRVKWCHSDTVEWGSWVSSPAPGYIDSGGQGPIPMREVEWIEVQPVEQRHRGRLLSKLAVDHSNALIAAFQKQGVRIEPIDHCLRILPKT